MVRPIKMILATDLNALMSYNHKIPWREPVDQQRFKHLTTGHSVIMGKTTYLDLPPSKLPNRDKYVLSSTPQENTQDTFWHNSLENAVEDAATKPKDIWIIGGLQVYTLAMLYRLPDEIDWTIINYKWVGEIGTAVVQHVPCIPLDYQVVAEYADLAAPHLFHRIYRRRTGKLYLDQ